MPSARVLLALATSLDGYLADTRGGVDWLTPYFTAELKFDELFAQVSVLIMGRATYDQALAFGWPHAGKPTVVLTSRPLVSPPPGVRAHDGDVAALVRELKSDYSGIIWLMGGAKAAHHLLERKLIDELELSLIPILLGNGLPLFLPRDSKNALALVEQQTYANGIVRLRYRLTD